MSVDIPQPFVVDGDVDAALSGSLTTHVTGIPSTFTINIDRLPKIQLGIDPLEVRPLDLLVRIKELPSIRAHLPADFKVGLSLLGIELLTVRLCGKAMAITEPYRPNPCEICGGGHGQDNKPGILDTAAPPRLTIGEA